MFQTSGASAGEVVVRVEDPDHEPGQAEQDHDREQHLAQPDGEVVERGRRLVAGQQRHQHRRDEDEQQRQDGEREQDQPGQRGGELDRLAPALVLEQLREDRDERARERGVGDERADQVRDLEGQRERRGRAGRAEVRAGDDLADQTRDAAEPGEDAEDDGVAGAPAGRAGPAREVGRVRVGDEVRDRRLGHRAGQQDAGVALRARFRRRSLGRRIPSPRGPSRLALEAGGFALRRRSRGRRVAARPTHRRAL